MKTNKLKKLYHKLKANVKIFFHLKKFSVEIIKINVMCVCL